MRAIRLKSRSSPIPARTAPLTWRTLDASV